MIASKGGRSLPRDKKFVAEATQWKLSQTCENELSERKSVPANRLVQEVETLKAEIGAIDNFLELLARIVAREFLPKHRECSKVADKNEEEPKDK